MFYGEVVSKPPLQYCTTVEERVGRENAVTEDRKHRVILEDHILSDTSGSLTLAWAINLPRL